MMRQPPVFPSPRLPAPMAKTAKKSKTAPKLGALPEWNLNDLYPGPDSPELKWDLENAETRCVAFEADFKGQARGARRRDPTPARRSPRRSNATRRSTTRSAG